MQNKPTPETSGNLLPLTLLAGGLAVGPLAYASSLLINPPSPREICGSSEISFDEVLQLPNLKRDINKDRLKYAADIALISNAMVADGLTVQSAEIDMQEYLANPSAADELTHASVAHWNAVEESTEIYAKIAALLCEQEEDFKRLSGN